MIKITPENSEQPKNFRGYIQSKISAYYLLNEIIDDNYTKVFSAVKVSQTVSEKVLDVKQKFCVRYINKNWIINEVFKKSDMEDRARYFFQSLKKKYDSFKKINHKNIQELKDYIDEEDALYLVFEYFDYTLKDYLQILREPYKFSWYPFEVTARNIIYQILDAVVFSQSETISRNFGGVLNSNDIMVFEVDEGTTSNKRNANNCVIKFPHPFMLDIFTIAKILDDSGDFPSFYAPELYSILNRGKAKKELDMSNVMGMINNSMDVWSLGCLLYEIVFDTPPFIFEDIGAAESTLVPDKKYKVFEKRISKLMFKTLNHCLQHDEKKRFDQAGLIELRNEMMKGNENLEELEKNLKKNILEKTDWDYILEVKISGYQNL